MTKLEALIHELCPDGVEHKMLGEVCDFQRGRTITASQAVNGDVPVIAGGQKPSYYHNQANRTGETIAVSSSGAYAGFVSFWTVPVFLSDSFSVKPHDCLVPKYVYYLLTNLQKDIHGKKKGGGVPHVHGSDLSRIMIPLPPLSIQHEIVRILDNFTELTAELTAELAAELAARKKQYEHYRNELLALENEADAGSADGRVQWVTLGEVAKIISGRNQKGRHDVGRYPVFGSTGIIGYTDNSIFSGPRLLIARVGANCGYVYQVEGQFDVSDNTLILSFSSGCIIRYAYHLLTNFRLNKYAKGGGQPLVTAGELKKLRIPLPSLTTQSRIVSILDKFDALTTDISQGLPAEIEARKKQYEHYRGSLLTFKEKTA